jgi:hypothetical protein
MTADPTPDYFAEIRRQTIERIDRHGYTATVVGTGECSVPGCDCAPDPYPYAYSIGLCEHDHPELVVFGLDLWHVNEAMDPIVAAARAGRPLAVGAEHRHVFADVHEYCLIPVPELWVRRDPGRIGGWIDVYRSALPPFLQICWADQHGAMPWDDGCEQVVRDLQPILADDPLRYPKPSRTTGRHRRRH